MGSGTEAEPVDRRTKSFLMCIRQAIIIILGGIEDFLGLERSITPRRKRG